MGRTDDLGMAENHVGNYVAQLEGGEADLTLQEVKFVGAALGRAANYLDSPASAIKESYFVQDEDGERYALEAENGDFRHYAEKWFGEQRDQAVFLDVYNQYRPRHELPR